MAASGALVRGLRAWIVLLLLAGAIAAGSSRAPSELATTGDDPSPALEVTTRSGDAATSSSTTTTSGPAPTTTATTESSAGGAGGEGSTSGGGRSGTGSSATSGSGSPAGGDPPAIGAPPRPAPYDDTPVIIPVAHGASVRAWVQCCASFDPTDLETWSEALIPPRDEREWHVAETWDLQHLRPNAFEQRVTVLRLGHLPSAKAWLVETWQVNGKLRYRVTDTPYVPGARPREGEHNAVRFSHGWAHVYPRGPELELAGLGFDDGAGEFQGAVTSAKPTGLVLHRGTKVRWYVTAHRNVHGELFTTERTEPFLPPRPPPIGVPTRYDDPAGAGHVVVTRTGPASVTVNSSAPHAPFMTVPPVFQSTFGECLVLWVHLVYAATWNVRCFDVVVDGGRITAMGFHDVDDPVPPV